MTKVEYLNEIKIDNGVCFMCGGTFELKTKKKKTMHHCIEQCLKPMFNIIVPLHLECHEKLNALYAVSQPKPKAVGINDLKRALNDVQGIKGHYKSGVFKVEKIEAKIQKKIDDREVKKDV